MTITAAVEAMKIIAPVAGRMINASRVGGAYLVLMRDFRNREGDMLRLLSLMYAVPVETIVSWIGQDVGAKPRPWIVLDMIHAGFRVNPIIGLITGGVSLGLISNKEVDEWLMATR